MARPKLTRQQLQRIQAAQQRRRRRIAEGPQPGDVAGTGERRGTLVAHHGGQVLVEDASGGVYACVPRRNLGTLVAGDEVVWQAEGADGGTVLARLPRRSVLTRPDASGRPRPMAANVDRLLVVISATAELNLWQIDRFLVAGEHAGIAPALLANKVDLLDDPARAALAAQLAPYRRLGYPVVFTTTHRADGLIGLHDVLQGCTGVFVGQSGVGKSSLVNALLPQAQARVGETSEASGKGRHTTTAARLYPLPDGGRLIDSPGVREFGLTAMSPGELAAAFPEFRGRLGQCRFRDCRHVDEPGCALAEAVAEGTIDARRLESYRKMLSFAGEETGPGGGR